MNKDLKSLLWSIAIILLYVYATVGIVELFWNCSDYRKREARIKFLLYMIFILTLIIIIGSYHLLGHAGSTIFFQAVIFFHVAYLVIGSVFKLFSKSDH